MEAKIVKANLKNVPSSPQKMRLVVDLVRGKNVAKAIDSMQFLRKKAALFLRKALLTASANAKDLYGAEPKDLIVSAISVDEGKKQKKVNFASRGRVSRMTKRKSHINLEVRVK